MNRNIISARFVASVLFILGIQCAIAGSQDDMGKMEGMRQSPPAAGFSFGQPGRAANVQRSIRVTMHDLSFTPPSLEVAAGQTIRFVVTNKGKIDHDFTIGDAGTQTAHRTEMAEAIRKGREMAHGDDPNAMLVKAGQKRELIWKFTRAGKFEFDCNVPGHYEAGMKGTIVVR